MYNIATDYKRDTIADKRNESLQNSIDDYFNFSEFSDNKFNELFKNLILGQKTTLSINDALMLARNAPESTYVVILKSDNKISHIGKTTQPLSYIGNRSKKINADSAYFQAIDSDYIDDLIIALKVYYDLELDKIRIGISNRKYSTLNKAVFIYNRAESRKRKEVINAIKRSNMRIIDLLNGQTLIDKIILHNALYSNNYK